MKKTLYSFTILTVLCFALLSACKKKKEDSVQPAATDNKKKEAVSKKWTVGDGSGKMAVNNTDYLWFEFTVEGVYIVLKQDSTTLTGSYVLNSDGTMTLKGLGVITISNLQDNSFNFSLKLDTGVTETIFTNVGQVLLTSSNRTNLLCKTWKVQRQYGETYGIEFDYTYPGSAGVTEYVAVFSKYGTYMLAMKTAGGETIYNRVWQWEDSNETTICYGDASSACTGSNDTSVEELSATSFKLHTVIPAISHDAYDVLVSY